MAQYPKPKSGISPNAILEIIIDYHSKLMFSKMSRELVEDLTKEFHSFLLGQIEVEFPSSNKVENK